MEWRLAKSLTQLREEVNAKWPLRSKDSDGTIGDAQHASRTSDHNPWIADPPGVHVVSATDITHDPAHGVDTYALAEWLRLTHDSRIKYIISNRRIVSGDAGPSPWEWRPYHGQNPHDHHVHISVKADKPHYDSMKPWGLANVTLPTHDFPHPEPAFPTLRRGSVNQYVAMAQRAMHITADGKFGQLTELAVEHFQKAHGLHADGIIGPQTWKELLK